MNQLSEPDVTADVDYPVSVFGPRHGLSVRQVWIAQRQKKRARPLRGSGATTWRAACQLGGIVSAVKGDRVKNLGGGVLSAHASQWGRHMRALRGGHAMAAKHPEKLREIAALGGRRSGYVRRQRKEAAARAADLAALPPRLCMLKGHAGTAPPRPKSWLEL